MKIFCMSDIHGCLAAFNAALDRVVGSLKKKNTKLVLLGDYIHGGADADDIGVLDRVISLQRQYGNDKVIALMGNHEELVLLGESPISYSADISDEEQVKYVHWMKKLPRFYTEGNTIFVHAGIDEKAGDLWKCGTGDEIFVGKFPAETGQIEDLDMKVVAGHVGTAEISGNPEFNDIYFDGASHYYIDGTTVRSGKIPVLMVDTAADKYYSVTETGDQLILPYDAKA